MGPYAIDATCLTPNARREDYLGLVEVVTRPGFEQVLFVEMGWGADQHGQNATKACVRAARNAIELTAASVSGAFRLSGRVASTP